MSATVSKRSCHHGDTVTVTYLCARFSFPAKYFLSLDMFLYLADVSGLCLNIYYEQFGDTFICYLILLLIEI